MKVFIVEDELPAVDRLERLLAELDPCIESAGRAASVKQALKWLASHPAPDLILMDIELADGQCFEIFARTEVRSPVIFITSYDEHALRAFSVNSIDYLLKPVKKEDLKRSLEKLTLLRGDKSTQSEPGVSLKKLLEQLAGPQAPDFRRRFLVKWGQKLLSVETEDIAYFYVEGRATFFKTWSNQKYLVDYSLDELEASLDPQVFFRAGRGSLIHIKSVMQIYPFFNGKLKLLLKPDLGKEVLVSREKARAFRTWMGE